MSNFYINNEIKIGKDYESHPAPYYSSLQSALKHYFATFRDQKDAVHYTLTFLQWNRVDYSRINAKSAPNIVFTILGFHRFFELHIKAVLSRVHSFMAVKPVQKTEDLILLFNGTLEADKINSIEYSEAFNRFIFLLKQCKKSGLYKESLSEYLSILKMLIDKNGLQKLADYRNTIIHNGKTLPNLFALDYLVSQHLIPLVNKIIQIEIKNGNLQSEPYYFKTNSEIFVLDEIERIKFCQDDFTNKKQHLPLTFKLIQLGHLKELGRTSIKDNLMSRKGVSYNHPYYGNLKDKSERIAKSENQHESFLRVTKCLSCGVNSLVVYKKVMLDIYEEEVEIRWLICYHCDYSIKNNVGEPADFGFGKERFFVG